MIMATKGMTVMRQGTEDFTINDPNIADEFSASTAYKKGDYCYYQGNLWRFTSDHAAGAWNAGHASTVKLAEKMYAQEESPFKCVPINAAITYNKSSSYGTYTFKGTDCVQFSKVNQTEEGSFAAKGMILETGIDLIDRPSTINTGFHISPEYGVILWCECNGSSVAGIGIAETSALSWNSQSYKIVKKQVEIHNGYNFIPLTDLVCLSGNIATTVKMSKVFVETVDFGDFAVSIVKHSWLADMIRDNDTISFMPYLAALTYNDSYTPATTASENGKIAQFSKLNKTEAGSVDIRGILIQFETATLFETGRSYTSGEVINTDFYAMIWADGEYGANIGIAKGQASSWNAPTYKTGSKKVALHKGYNLIKLDNLVLGDSVGANVVYKTVFINGSSSMNDFSIGVLAPSGLIGAIHSVQEDVETLKNNTDIADYGMIFWGDSLTAGAGGSGTTYCQVCANLLGKTYLNCGVGGETEQTIAARQGGNNLIIQPGSVNGNYSFAQMLDENGKQVLPLRQGTGGGTVNPVIINGQECALSLSDETYTISGYTGSLSFAVPARFSGYDDSGEITVIWAGTNGLGTNTVEERISYIRSMLSKVGKKYVVLGISMGTEEQRAADDAAMALEFGNHFFPTRKMLVNYGLDVVGITPTATDESDIAAGRVPDSLRSDEVHLNADGYTALGTMLAGFIVGLGYAEYSE